MEWVYKKLSLIICYRLAQSKDKKRTKMSNFTPLMRSKSDGYPSAGIYCPTPIRRNDVAMLNQVCELNNCQHLTKSSRFDNTSNPYFLRKFPSHGPFDTHSKDFHNAQDCTIEENSSDGSLFNFGTQGAFVREIPTRAANPVIHDPRFEKANLPHQEFMDSLNTRF